MRLLVVEDENELRNSLMEGLRLCGYYVNGCSDGEEADFMVLDGEYDLIVLDLNLPKIDGLTILQNIRKVNKTVNVIILTAKDSIQDKVRGLDLGANDYLTKPFHFEELEARIRSLLRRKTIQQDAIIHQGQLSFNTLSHMAYVNEMSLNLTKKELDLLEYLLINKGCIATLQELIEHVWDGSVDEFSNSVRVHLSSLRRKLKAALGYDPITNMIGKGYIIKEIEG